MTPRLAAWRDHARAQHGLQGMACVAVALLTGALWWVALLSDMDRETVALRQRLAATVMPQAPVRHAASRVAQLQREIAEREARWLRDDSATQWAQRVQQGVRREAGLQLEQLRAVREASAGSGLHALQHPAQAVSLRLNATFEALLRWLAGHAEDATAVALQPLRLVGEPDGRVRVEAHALAFRGVPRRSAAMAPEQSSRLPLGKPPHTVPLAPSATTFSVSGAQQEELRVRNPFDPTPLAAALGLYRTASKPSPGGAGPDLSRLREPLEAHDLRDLRVTGVLHDEHQRVAVVEAGGIHHGVSVGRYLGRQHGRVERITDSGLELAEWQQHEGRWRRVAVHLRVDTPTTQGAQRSTGGQADE